MNSQKSDVLRDNLIFFKKIEKKLLEKKVVSARYEAEALLSHFGKLSRLDLFTGAKPISSRAKIRVEKAVRSRISGKPLGYILNSSEFCGLKFFVNSDTLIPRPETELLVDAAAEILKEHCNEKTSDVLELGTGSGCVAVSLTIRTPGCRMTALDISEKALRVARKNIHSHKLEKRIKLLKSDLFDAFRASVIPSAARNLSFSWDIIISNPPYVPKEDMRGLSREVRSEPVAALNGGLRGLEIIRRILNDAPRWLKKNGWLLMEIGDGQAALLKKELSGNSFFSDLRFIKDFSGVDRILIIRRK